MINLQIGVDWEGKISRGQSLEYDGMCHTLIRDMGDGIGEWCSMNNGTKITFLSNYWFHTGWKLSKINTFTRLYEKLQSL